MLKKIVVSGVVFSNKNNLVLLVAILIWDQNTKKIYVYICLVYYNKVSLSTLSSVRRLGTSMTQSHRVLLHRSVGHAVGKAIDISLPL